MTFEPPIIRRDLDASVIRLRAVHDAEVQVVAATIVPRIEGHLHVMQETTDAIIRSHQRVTDELDFDLAAETRWVAVWR